MKMKSKISILLGGLLLSSVTLSNVMAEEMTWLNTREFIAGENVLISHDAPEYPGSIKVELIDNDDTEEPVVGEIITRFKNKEDYELTSVLLCLRDVESAPEFVIDIYQLGLPSLNTSGESIVLEDILLRTSGDWFTAETECSEIPLSSLIIPETVSQFNQIMSTDETLLLSISFDFTPDNNNAIISAVGLGQTSTYLMIEDCNTFVPDVEFEDGTPLSEVIAECADSAKNHGKFVSCVTKSANTLKKAGDISGKQKGQITRCAAKSSVGK